MSSVHQKSINTAPSGYEFTFNFKEASLLYLKIVLFNFSYRPKLYQFNFIGDFVGIHAKDTVMPGQ